MKTSHSKPEHLDSYKQNHFRARLKARLVFIFISLTLSAQRITRSYTQHQSRAGSAPILALTLPFLGALIITVLAEYLLYRKYGLKILKYTNLIDIIFLGLFTAEWIMILDVQFDQTTTAEDSCYELSSYLIFTSFAWRTLLQMLITPYWQLRCVPPVCAYIYTVTYTCINEPHDLVYTLIRGILQALYVVLIFYLEHKINLQLLLGNLHQAKWLRFNEFILNNIPENIAIIDLQGNCQFVSDHFKKFLGIKDHSISFDEFFLNVKDLSHQDQSQDQSDLGMKTEVGVNETHPAQHCSLLEYKLYSQERQGTLTLRDIIGAFSKLVKTESIQENSFQVFDGKFKHPDDPQEKSLEIKISFINHSPKQYILLMIRDTTQRDLILTLQDNSKYKDQLLASVSHELRTPLNGNINLVEAAVKSKDVSEKVKEAFLIPALKSSKFLLHLINDILDMTQIKAQKLRLIFQQANLRETLLQTMQLIEIHAKRKGLDLQTEFDPALPESFYTDHVRLSQIVLNLANNSVKFTEKGEVKLTARTVEGNSNLVQISIEDSGIGLSEDQIGRLFKDFTQIDLKDRAKINPTGVGLGLKIAFDLALLLGPKDNQGITVESTLGFGSKFSFVVENRGGDVLTMKFQRSEGSLLFIPVEFDTNHDLQEKMARNSSCFKPSQVHIPSLTLLRPPIKLCSCPKVLVVDDDPFNVMAYEVILNTLSIKYECAYNGRSAIEKMLNRARYPCTDHCTPHRLVFMDEEMPEMTGKEAVAEIRKMQQQGLLVGANIVGCTAHHEGEEIEKFLKSGIQEYIPKPISKPVIKKMLDKYGVE